MTIEAPSSNLNPPLHRSPLTERLGRRKNGAVGRLRKVARPEVVGLPGKSERSEVAARLEKAARPATVARPEKIGRTEAVERPGSNGVRIYWKADPPESGGGGRKRTASRWYRTRHPDRVLPQEAVVP